MRKNNNKGFTLLELLISIFILTTVIFIGYSIINKSTTYIQNRKNIHEGQLAINDINKYLTDDLEHAERVVLLSDYSTEANVLTENSTQENGITNDNLKEKFEVYLDNTRADSSTDEEFTYEYNIDYKKNEEEIKTITYNVKIIKENNNYKYSISREAKNEVSITFIANKILTDEVLSRDDKLPLKIELESPYEVTLGYTGKDNYEFVEHQLAIASRLLEMSPVPPNLGDIDVPDDWKNFNTIGFWTADSTKKAQDNLYTWVSSETEIIKDAYADQTAGNNDNFNIEGYVKYNDNDNDTLTGSYIGYDEIKSDTEWQGQVKDISIGSKKIIDIYIYVSKDTTLEDFKIESKEASITIKPIDGKIVQNNNSIDLKSGWYRCEIQSNDGTGNLLNFEVIGKLSIDKSKVSSGYAYVAYQKEDYKQETNYLDGDIVFNFRSEQINSNQFNIDGIGKVKDSQGNYVEVSNKSDLRGKNQLEDFRIEIAFFYNSIQITGEAESVQVTINQNQIGKNINNTKKLLLKVNESIEIKRVEQAKWEKLSSQENILKFDSNRAVIYLDLSKSDFNTISFTLIEE